MGAVIRLRVTASNLDGTASAPQRGVRDRRAAAPRNVAVPAVSGPAKLNGTLTAAPGDWTPADADFTYAWQRDGSDIAGATSSTYTLAAGGRRQDRAGQGHRDQRRRQRERDLRRDGADRRAAGQHGGPRRAVRDAAGVRPRSPPPPAPGTPRARRSPTCGCAARPMRPPSPRLRGGGTGATYALTADDVGRRLGVRVTATTSGGTTTVASALTATVARLTLTNLTPPSIIGNAYAGETLTGDAGRWTFPSPDLAYDWRRCDADGASNCVPVGDGGARYPLTDGDVDRTIVLVVAATTPGQSATARSAPLTIRARPVPRSVVAPAVTGTAVRGRTLHAGTGTWSNDPNRLSYQWLRCDGAAARRSAAPPATPTCSTKADEGFAITVVVTAANAWAGSATAAATGPGRRRAAGQHQRAGHPEPDR